MFFLVRLLSPIVGEAASTSITARVDRNKFFQHFYHFFSPQTWHFVKKSVRRIIFFAYNWYSIGAHWNKSSNHSKNISNPSVHSIKPDLNHTHIYMNHLNVWNNNRNKFIHNSSAQCKIARNANSIFLSPIRFITNFLVLDKQSK